VPAAEYTGNLEEMAKLVRAAGGQMVFVRAPGDISAQARARLVGSNYLLPGDDPNALHRDYLRALDEAAAAVGAPEIDAAGVFAAVGNEPPRLLGDGIHPTPLGHRVMAAIVAESIAGLIPGLSGSGQPLDAIARQIVAASTR
jgi:lysophospholipase L1-like esterase